MSAEAITVDQPFIDAMDEYRHAPGQPFFEACRDSVVVFSEKMLGIRLYAWQVYYLSMIQRAVDDYSIPREFLALTSRQIGKSTAVAIFSLWCCLFNRYPGTAGDNTIVGIVSAGDVQAKKLLNEMKKLMRLGDMFMRTEYTLGDGSPRFGKDFLSGLLDDKEANNTTTITFQSYDEKKHGSHLLKGSKVGSVIKSYPPTSIVLGETFTVIFEDEAGKTDKISDEFHSEYLYPTGNSTNAIRIYTSTPWLSSGFFYRLVDPDNLYPPQEVNVVTFTIEAIKLENPQYYETVMRDVRAKESAGDLDLVRRAYYCEFVKNAQSYFNKDSVFDVFADSWEMVESSTKEVDIGVDFGGQTTSRSVITVSHYDEDTGEVQRLYKKVYGVKEDDNLLEDLKNDIMKRFPRWQRIIPDDCPQGDYMIRKMEEMGWNVHPMNFRSDKVKKYGAFRALMNKGRVKSFMDESLQTEMLAMELSQKAKQSVIQHAPGYTDDEIDSFVLSAYFFLDVEDGVEVFEW